MWSQVDFWRRSQTHFQNYPLPAFLSSERKLNWNVWLNYSATANGKWNGIKGFKPLRLNITPRKLYRVGGMLWGHRPQEHGKTWGKNFRENNRFSSPIQMTLVYSSSSCQDILRPQNQRPSRAGSLQGRGHRLVSRQRLYTNVLLCRLFFNCRNLENIRPVEV